jgi:N-acetyl-beta-hexosaminidase
MRELIGILLGILLITVVLNFGLTALMDVASAMSEEGPRQSANIPQTLQGELLKIEGEFYLVKDQTGKEVRLHVDKDTKMMGDITPGAKIEAQVWTDGYAISIKRLKG